MIHFLEILEEGIKVSLFVDRGEYSPGLSLAISTDNPSETHLSTWQGELLEQRPMRFKDLTSSFKGQKKVVQMKGLLLKKSRIFFVSTLRFPHC